MRLTKGGRNYQDFDNNPQLTYDPGFGLDQTGGAGPVHIPGGLERIARLNTWFRKYGNDYFNLTSLKIITILPIK